MSAQAPSTSSCKSHQSRAGIPVSCVVVLTVGCFSLFLPVSTNWFLEGLSTQAHSPSSLSSAWPKPHPISLPSPNKGLSQVGMLSEASGHPPPLSWHEPLLLQAAQRDPALLQTLSLHLTPSSQCKHPGLWLDDLKASKTSSLVTLPSLSPGNRKQPDPCPLPFF